MDKHEILGVLKKHLQTAIELEHATLPPYLFAFWSIHGDSKDATHARGFFLSVIQEEMLHLAMVCNILNAIGGTPVLNDPSLLPAYPCALPGHSKTSNAFLVHLNKCCPKSIANFVQIELPETMASDQHPSDGWSTIGEFYDEIEALLRHDILTDADFLFGKQLAGSYNPGKGKLYTVHSKQDALDALNEVIDQGEGHSGKMYDEEHELTHYWKFRAIGELMENGLWDYKKDVFDVCMDPDDAYFTEEAKALNQMFNVLYSKMLDALQAGFTSEKPTIDEAIRIMFLLKDAARKLMNIPLESKGGNAGPTFNYIAVDGR